MAGQESQRWTNEASLSLPPGPPVVLYLQTFSNGGTLRFIDKPLATGSLMAGRANASAHGSPGEAVSWVYRRLVHLELYVTAAISRAGHALLEGT